MKFLALFTKQLLLTIAVFACFSFCKAAFADPAHVLNVVPNSVDDRVILNITIRHSVNTTFHHVNFVEVVMEANRTSLPIASHPLAPDGTFFVLYDLGQVSGTPTVTVNVSCSFTGWSGATTWTGPVPEFSLQALLITLTLTSSMMVLAYCQKRKRG